MILECLENLIKNGQLSNSCTDSFISELDEYVACKKSPSSSITIFGDFSNQIYFDRLKLIRLLTHYLNDKIYEWDLEYILRIIEFNYEGDDERIEEVLFNFSDSYLGIQINEENVSFAIAFLTEDINNLDSLILGKSRVKIPYRRKYN